MIENDIKSLSDETLGLLRDIVLILEDYTKAYAKYDLERVYSLKTSSMKAIEKSDRLITAARNKKETMIILNLMRIAERVFDIHYTLITINY
jgi:hypothetical protein